MQNKTNNRCLRVSTEPVECVSPPLRCTRSTTVHSDKCIEEYQLFNNDTQTDAFSWNPSNFFNIHEVLLSPLTDMFKQYPELLCVQVQHCGDVAWIDCSFATNVHKTIRYNCKATGWFSGAITPRQFPAYLQFHHSSTKCVCLFADGGICAVTAWIGRQLKGR